MGCGASLEQRVAPAPEPQKKEATEIPDATHAPTVAASATLATGDGSLLPQGIDVQVRHRQHQCRSAPSYMNAESMYIHEHGYGAADC